MNMTQSDLAELTSISLRTIRDIELNINSINLNYILRCLEVLGYTLQPTLKKIIRDEKG